MKNIFTFLFVLLTLFCNAQVNNLQIGYQEFPTTITGQASDSSGNIYYSGTFKGQLKVKDSVLETGAGLEDIFFVKTNAAGKVQYSKTFGSDNTENSVLDGLASLNNNFYLVSRILQTVNFQSVSVSPYSYQYVSGAFTNCIVNLDEGGTVKWVNKTNVNINRIYAANNIIHVIGLTNPPTGAVKYNNQLLYDSVGYGYLVHLMLDTSGNLINYKAITRNSSIVGFTSPLYFNSYRDGKICMLLGVLGTTSFQLDKKTITLPSTSSTYYVLIKTDTAYSAISSKIINNSINYVTTSGFKGVPVCLSKQDSLYMVLTTESQTSVSFDGLNIPAYRRNVLVVLDSSLKAKRVADMGSSYVGTDYANTTKRRLFIRSINTLKNNLFFTGAYVGLNESPIMEIPIKDSIISLVPGFVSTVDVNGSSKSFVLKTSYGITNGSINWIGDHSVYETPGLFQTFNHNINDSLFTFSVTNDNVWNPWTIDEKLKVISGSMSSNADQADVAQLVEYLSDGSRIIIGSARGRTALDSAAATGIKSNLTRTDAFITKINSKGEVKWYKRVLSTLTGSEPRRLIIKDSKAYFLINYSQAVNDSNYLKINDKVYDVKTSASLLASIDTSGLLKVINLENQECKYATIRDFNLCPNGDIAFIVGPSTNGFIPFPSFPQAFGFYLYRIDPLLNKIIARRSLINVNVVPSHIEIDKNDEIYLSSPMASVQNQQFSLLKMHDGNKFIDSIIIENNLNGQDGGNLGIIKMKWNNFTWFKKTSGRNNFGISTSFPETFIINNKLIIVGRPSFTPAGGNFFWDKQLVFPSLDLTKTYMFMLDTAGKMEMTKTIDNFSMNYAKKRNNGVVILSGSNNNPINIDTISVGNEGLTDALSIVVDSNFKASNTFRLSTPYSESMFDMDIYKDSLANFAYTAQATPSFRSNRTSINVNDYTEDAFIGSQVIAKGIALPLQLLSFTANRNNNIVTLNWAVSQNEEGKQYIVQQALNSTTFKNINVQNSIHTSGIGTYTAIDNLYDYGKYLYRLKMVSTDGKITYSNIVQVLYPPKENSFYYDLNNQQLYILRSNSSSYQFILFDAVGKEVITSQKSTGNRTISLSALPKGQYIIRTQDAASNSRTYKFIK